MTWREKSVISGDSGKLYLIMQGGFYCPKSQPRVDFRSRSADRPISTKLKLRRQVTYAAA